MGPINELTTEPRAEPAVEAAMAALAGWGHSEAEADTASAIKWAVSGVCGADSQTKDAHAAEARASHSLVSELR